MAERTFHARSRSLQPTTLGLLHTIHRISGCSYRIWHSIVVLYDALSQRTLPRASLRLHHAGEQQAAAATFNCISSRLGYREPKAICAVCDCGLGRRSLVANGQASVGPVQPFITTRYTMSLLVYTSRDSVCPEMSQYS
jgi:hypothetical protein